MSDPVQLACRISATNPDNPVGLEIWLDDVEIYHSDRITEPVDVAHEFEDSDGDHWLRFVMKNKTQSHTQIDANGEIVTDSCIVIENISFDQIELGQLVIDHAVYEHDFNGTADMIQDRFYGTMGCNGTVGLSFTTPVYLWLLANM